MRAIINLAHNLGLEVVAEGIETPAQFEFLREQGCDIAQGYLISRPMTTEAARPRRRNAAAWIAEAQRADARCVRDNC